jgi:hypothetical protein
VKLGPGIRIDYAKLGREMETKRAAAGLSVLDATIECGFTNSRLWTRLAGGMPCHADTFVRILHWLGTTDHGPFTFHDPKGDLGW